MIIEWSELSDGLRENFTAGIILLLVEFILIYLIAGWIAIRIQKRVADNTWSKSRNEFRAQCAIYAYSIAKPTSHYFPSDENDFSHLREEFDFALQNLIDISQRFDSFVIIYSRTLPHDWLVAASLISDNLKVLAGDAKLALRNVELVRKRAVALSDTYDEGSIWKSRSFQEADVGGNFILSDTEDNRALFNFSFHIYKCASLSKSVSLDLLSLANIRHNESAIKNTRAFQEKWQIFEGITVDEYIRETKISISKLSATAQNIKCGRFSLILQPEFE